MKLKLLPRALPVLALILALSLPVFYGCPKDVQHPIVGDTLALWTFEGTLADVSGNGHDGTPIGHVHYASDRSKTVGRALVLDSAASVLVQNVGNLAFTGQSSYTITAWIRTASQGDQAIYNWGPAKGGSPGLVLGLAQGHAYAAITAEPSTVEIKGSAVVADGRWHLLTLTVDQPNKVSLYVDTTLAGQSNTGSLKPQNQNAGTLRIGRYADSSRAFYGSIAKLGVFNYPFSQLRVSQEFMDDVAPGPPITGLTSPSENLTLACDNQGRVARAIGNTNFVFDPPNGTALTPLHAIDALDENVAIAGGDNGTVIATNDGGVSWVSVSVPPSIATQTVFAVRFADTDRVILAGGTEEPNAPSNFLLVGTRTGPWPQFNWQIVPPVSGHAFSGVAVNGLHALAVGWDGNVYQCYDIAATNTTWTLAAIPPSGSTLHFTSVDLHTPTGEGSLVTDDGYHFPVTGLNVGPSDWSMPGNALWTTVSSNNDLWIGGAMGNATQQATEGPDAHSAILIHTGTASPSPDAPRQIWYAGARSPSGAARIGGLEGYIHNGTPGTVVFVQQ
jgi:hypothetical protein